MIPYNCLRELFMITYNCLRELFMIPYNCLKELNFLAPPFKKVEIKFINMKFNI